MSESTGKKMSLVRFLPFLQWIGELKDKNILRADILSGITVALVLIPQSMAYAQLAGLPPYYGLYAAFLPPMVAALFGSSRQLATGPVAVVSLMSAAALEPIATAGSGSFILYSVMLAFMVGCFQLMLGLLRLGVLVNFLAHPVVIGFTNAAAIIIATSQLGKIFGVSVDKAEHHYETVWNTILAAVDFIHWPTFFMAVLAFGIMISLKKINPRLPNVLIAVVITTVLSWAMNFQELETVSIKAIADQTTVKRMTDKVALKKNIDATMEKIVAEEKEYAEAAKTMKPHDNRLLLLRQDIDRLKLKKAQLSITYNVIRTQLRDSRFVVTRDKDGKPAFYLKKAVPSGIKTGSEIWSLQKYKSADEIVMRNGGKVVGVIPEGLPAFKVPTFDLSVILQLLATAIAISLIGFMEAYSIAKAMAAKTKQRLNANRELMGQGIGNITGSLFQSYSTSGSFSRSAVNISAGAVTGFSSVVTSIVVIITLLWLTPLLYHLPMPTLAAVIMMAVIGLVNIKAIKHTWQASKHDGAVAVITFALTLAFAPHLDKGIMIGVLLSLGLYLYRSMRPRVVFLSRFSDGTFRDAEANNLDCCDDIGIIRFEGRLYFANISFFEEKVQKLLSKKPELKFLVIDFVSINEIDATGEEVIRELSHILKETGITVLLCRLKKPVMDTMIRTGFVEEHGEHLFFRRPERAIDYAWSKLEDGHKDTCPLNADRTTG